MTRKRKIQLTAVPALAALAAVALVVSSAGAHTPATFEFKNNNSENTKITSRQDGVGAQAHQVFSIPGYGAFTCSAGGYEGTVEKKQTTTIKITQAIYLDCTAEVGGEALAFAMNGCEMSLTATGELVIASAPGEECIEGKQPMTFTAASGCVLSIPEQTVAGIGYTNITGGGGFEEVTLSMSLTKIKGSRSAKCASPGNFTTGEFKTGNSILAGQEDPGKKGPVSMKWLKTVP